jgi:RNA polymerase sigma-70 factor (ECF subfamily)
MFRIPLMRSNEPSTEPEGWPDIESVFNAMESPLLGYALRLTQDRDTAEDIVHEAFMKLHTHFEEVESPRRWLYRTIHNLALNHRRDTRRVVRLEPAEPGEFNESTDPQPLPDEQIARWEGIGLVRLTLESMDERTRQLVRLKFEENLSYKEISARTGLSVGNVGYLLHHALKNIGNELTRNGLVP